MIIKVTDSNFDGIIENGVSMIELGAEWCKPCASMLPIISDISETLTDVKVGKMDIDENPETPKKLGVRSIPTILIYKNGEIMDKKVGIVSKADLVNMISNHLN